MILILCYNFQFSLSGYGVHTSPDGIETYGRFINNELHGYVFKKDNGEI